MLGLIVVLTLTLVQYLHKGPEMAVFPGFASIIGIFLTIALYSDGSLTNLSGGAAQTIASASTSGTSVWQFIVLVPMCFTIAAGLLAGKRVSEAF